MIAVAIYLVTTAALLAYAVWWFVFAPIKGAK